MAALALLGCGGARSSTHGVPWLRPFSLCVNRREKRRLSDGGARSSTTSTHANYCLVFVELFFGNQIRKHNFVFTL